MDFSKKQLIGAIHLPNTLDLGNLDTAIKNAIYDLKSFTEGGATSVIIENNYDIPHTEKVSEETISFMVRVCKEIKKISNVPIGISVLWNDYEAAFKIAKASFADFIRVPVFVDNIENDYGKVFADPQKVIETRKILKVTNVKIFADVHVKHAKLIDPIKNLGESIKLAKENGADAIIITGNWTGEAPTIEDLKIAKNATSLPIIIGSGLSKENINGLFKYCDGAIFSTSVKEGDLDDSINRKSYELRISKEKVKELVENA